MSINVYKSSFSELPLSLQQTVTCSDPRSSQFLVVDIDEDLMVFDSTQMGADLFASLCVLAEKSQTVSEERDDALELIDYFVATVDASPAQEQLEAVFLQDPDLGIAYEDLVELLDDFELDAGLSTDESEGDDPDDKEDPLNPASNTPLSFH